MKDLCISIVFAFFSFIATSQNQPFIFTIEIPPYIAGGNNFQQCFFVTGEPGLNYDYAVDWGDGTVDDNNGLGISGYATSHCYSSSNNPVTYTVKITGAFPRIKMSNTGSSNLKLMSIEQWGDISWQSMENAFKNCPNLVINAADAPDLSQVTSMYGMFENCISLNQSINHWDVSNVTNMSRLFISASTFNQPLHNWDVSSVTIMSTMFSNASSFNQPLNNWDVSSVTNMNGMFNGSNSFNQSLNNWDVSQVTDMSYMFNHATAFNGLVGNWDVSNVTIMYQMFSSTTAFNQDLSLWDFHPDVDLNLFLSNSGLDTENYDAVLERFATLNLVDKTLGSYNLEYCDETYRNDLITNLGWVINGDSQDVNCSVGTENISIENEIVMYPNPTQGMVNIDLPITLQVEEVKVYNLNGLEVQSYKSSVQQINLDDLSSGVYFVRLITKEGVVTKRVLKK